MKRKRTTDPDSVDEKKKRKSQTYIPKKFIAKLFDEQIKMKPSSLPYWCTKCNWLNSRLTAVADEHLSSNYGIYRMRCQRCKAQRNAFWTCVYCKYDNILLPFDEEGMKNNLRPPPHKCALCKSTTRCILIDFRDDCEMDFSTEKYLLAKQKQLNDDVYPERITLGTLVPMISYRSTKIPIIQYRKLQKQFLQPYCGQKSTNNLATMLDLLMHADLLDPIFLYVSWSNQPIQVQNWLARHKNQQEWLRYLWWI